MIPGLDKYLWLMGMVVGVGRYAAAITGDAHDHDRRRSLANRVPISSCCKNIPHQKTAAARLAMPFDATFPRRMGIYPGAKKGWTNP